MSTFTRNARAVVEAQGGVLRRRPRREERRSAEILDALIRLWCSVDQLRMAVGELVSAVENLEVYHSRP